uniref:Pericentrin/AKAP-450 centrosomal targeting domain-containing protein n=1 Tax=Scophthalmus maximus TaxID=52904 RepID=A0A8D2ZUH4_SCOMX
MSSKDFIWDEVESLQQVTKGGTMQDMEDALAAETQSVEDLSQEEIRAAFGTEGVQQLQDFEAALQQRDGIITQLTANLQQAREEKDEIMKEFLELTEQSQKLQIQFQQLQAGETLRNTSHSSTAADLLQTRQQLVQYQQQLEEMNMEARKHQGRSSEHLEHISQLQHKLNEMEMVRRCIFLDINSNIIQQSDEKDLIIAEQERVISERDCSLTQLEDELETSEKRLRDLQQRMATKESELEKCLDDELSASRQKERMSSNEIMQLMGSVEDLQKRCHQGSLSESDTIQKMQEETERKLELVRAELDEMYGQQIVQMKQELNLQHTGKVEQMTELHSTELELLKAQLSQSSTVSTAEVDSLNAKIKALQETLEQSQAMHDKTIHELSQVSREKFNLQVNVEDLLQDLRTANEKVELVSHSLISQESQQGELQRFQETIDSLKSDLAAAQEAAQDAETKHESETTNYKIKLEMLEREKDAVLDRMAESQEAELERLRTQLLFSHEEELTQQREELQRESFMTTENLLNEAAIKHERALNELRISYEEELHLLRREKANFATERDELLHQILGLKEDLKLALHSSKADELVEQLQELQVEIEELRKGGEERVRMENEFQTLLKKTVVLETQTKDKEQCWANKWKEQELETKTLIESINTLREELDAKLMKIETLTTEKSKIQQQVNELREEIENQRTTFSFAEKNFEVNYQELKDEYVCLVQAKTQLEERTLKETLESEAKIASLQSQIRELEESSRDIKMEDITTDGKSLVEKYTTELMEKLNVTLSEKESLTARLSEVTEQLMFAESKVGQLDEELIKVRTEIAKVMAQKESLGTVQEKEQGLMREQTTGLDAQRKAKLQQEEQAFFSTEFHFRYLKKRHLIFVDMNFTFSLVFRNLLREANEKLSQVLADVLKTTAAAEETMGLHIQSLYDASSEGRQKSLSSRSFALNASVPPVAPGHAAESCQGSETGGDDASSWSGETEADDSMEVSQQMMDSLLQGAGTQLQNEEYLMGIGSRLQTALEKMLMAITDTTDQLEHARMTQTELMRESFRHNQEMSELLQKQEELQDRVSEESRAREQLALELHRAEGLIDGYTGERAALEEQLRQKAELQMSLEQELQVSRLQELEQERLQMQEERELLSRQQDAMREHAGPRELHLLEETEKLMKEKVEVQRQAEKENTDLLKQVKLLEAELEEQVNKVIELEHAQRTESGDLEQQIQALEKQLEKNRRFLDEQAVDREHERDFFQEEIQKLEKQLKNPQKLQGGSEQRNREVDQLTSQLKEKADWCSELLLSSEQLRRELRERDEEIDKLESRIRELEQALLASADSLEKVREGEGGGDERCAKRVCVKTDNICVFFQICNLEEQLEQFREELENKSEEVQQLQMQMEIQSKEISSQEQYQETRDSMLQVNTRPDEIDEKDELIKDLESQVECLRSEQERLKRNSEEELDQLNAVIDKLQQELANIEQKQAAEEDEDIKGEPGSGAWGPGKDEYDEMKQRMDLATKELNTLKTDHSKLLETYRCFKEREGADETEKLGSSEGQLEEALREKTAGLVVMQAQVKALEQSATSRVEELGLRIQELEDLVAERDIEISRCRLLVEQTQSHADGFQRRVSNLEEDLREKVAGALVSQATLEVFQQQQQQVVHLTQKLLELEVGLSGMQKDQELQKQLLSSSEEEVLEYEKRLAMLMDLLSQMKSSTHQRTSAAVNVRVQRENSSSFRAWTQIALDDVASSKEELNSYRQRNEKLLQELQVREVSISKLKEELQQLIKDVDSTKEELNSYRQQNEKLQDELHVRELSISHSIEQQHLAVADSFTQTEPLQMSRLSPENESVAKEEMEEVIGEFQEKIVQMQELHAAEILDMEARHISESENLRRDTHALEDECKALKAVIDKLRSTGVRAGNKKDTLLLREVHQEGMQVLSLSELPLSGGEPGNQFNVQGWVKEREDLLATVDSLKGLITQMKTRRETQVEETCQGPAPGGVDWRAELLEAVRQVFLRERSVLKSTLYSQLDLLDTSDAIIHLNQLERRLAEQVSNHNAMGSLHTAERSSLIVEIHQLRGQLEQLHQGETPAVSLTGECSIKEQWEGGGGGAGGVTEADRLLVEELKGELFQTKLELETTLKTQHKHLKELDTLRAEVSKKAAEVDALNDQLTDERKRGRDLQWAMEKEKCRTGRTEENKREQLEDLHLSLEEQKSRVAQLTLTLDQERRDSSQLSQQSELERLSLHRHLQELQVQLETERAKAREMSTALGRERELRTGRFSDNGSSNGEQVEEDRRGLEEDGSLLERLQRELDDKHAQVVHLLSQVEAQKLEVVRKEEELTLAGQRSRRDEEALQEARAQLENWEARISETQEQLEREGERRKSLEEEKERLEERLTRVGEQRGPRDGTYDLQINCSCLQTFAVCCGPRTFVIRCVFPQSVSLLAGGSSSSSSSLTERLLRQNAELTGFVSRLTEEKNDLRNHTLRLEEELRRYRQAGLGAADSFSSRKGASKMDSDSMLLSHEREAWTREKVRLEKALHLAQSQVARLRGEIRTDTLREITGPEADNAALKRMYGKYLRSESFRKALIYQKKYLLLLLGGFQECEEATLSLLSRMGSRPSLHSLESFNQRRRGLMRFRSAVRVSIALSRMRFLVKRWHKATGMSSTAFCSVNKNGTGQTSSNQNITYIFTISDGGYHLEVMFNTFFSLSLAGTDVRDSPYLHPGNHGGLTCSHLQSYDPDRALTDYISRLEALQRRLGSASSYAQLHFGLRR